MKSIVSSIAASTKKKKNPCWPGISAILLLIITLPRPNAQVRPIRDADGDPPKAAVPVLVPGVVPEKILSAQILGYYPVRYPSFTVR